MNLKPNDGFIHTVNRSVICLYSIVIVLALHMFIKLKLLLLCWITYRPNLNPPPPSPLPKKKYYKKNFFTSHAQKKQICRPIIAAKEIAQKSFFHSPPPPPSTRLTGPSLNVHGRAGGFHFYFSLLFFYLIFTLCPSKETYNFSFNYLRVFISQ